MSKINVLDCTLRDGGYVNNWEFGHSNILNISKRLENSNVDIIELGFMRDEDYNPDRSIYNSMNRIMDIIGEKKNNTIYAVMDEMANYFPLEKIAERSNNTPDLIRYTFWKRKIDDAFEYAKALKEKGYLVGVQPTRVEQYSDEDFAEMCKRFSTLNPYAIYIVDTFGLLTKEQLVRYAKIADEYVGKDIKIGYHAHNNMQQAFSNATTFCEMNLKHDIIVDSSIYGMGRGAGNLNSELICHYLNESGANYKLDEIYRAFDESVKSIHEKTPWGYRMEYFINAASHCNPNYVLYVIDNYDDCTVELMSKMISLIEGEDKYLYSDEKAEKYYLLARDLKE